MRKTSGYTAHLCCLLVVGALGCGGNATDKADGSAVADAGHDSDADTQDGASTDGASGSGSLQLSVVAGQLQPPGTGSGVGSVFPLTHAIVSDGAHHLYIADGVAISQIDLSTMAVTTIAGGTAQGGMNGTGAAATFDNPSGLALDGAGNLYIADSQDCTIRKVVIATGVVTTVAGMSRVALDQDGTGTGAGFLGPQSIAYDGAGNLYVVDASFIPDLIYNVRKIVLSSGVVSHVGPGISVYGSRPQQIVADGSGHLFFTDDNDKTVKMMQLSSGTITTIAGLSQTAGTADGTGSAARFTDVSGLTIDKSGDLFVTDDSAVRRIVIGSGVVTTLAGTIGKTGDADGTGPMASFARLVGLAADDAGNVWVADPTNEALRKVVVATGAVTTPFGGLATGDTDGTAGNARFGVPDGIVHDEQGNLYVADSANNAIRKIVAATGAVTSIPGVPSPHRLAYDGAGTLYVSSGSAIRKLVLSEKTATILAGSDTAKGSADGVGTAALFTTPTGVALDGAGHLYVVDNSTIRELDLATATVTTIAGKPGTLDSVDGLGPNARFNDPAGIAWSQGALYIADTYNDTIRRLDISTNTVSTIAGYGGLSGALDGAATTARFYYPSSVALDGAGNLYIADYMNDEIRKLDLLTNTVTTLIGKPGTGQQVVLGPIASSRLSNPLAVEYGPGNALYISVSAAVLVVK